ncbi:MarR family winged helix-turn-helix transcriptional regulator [Nocardia sp. alder85J]|uniref:MarR family winged helix-turn-helix transcriptional regulator n=1 Tax=Nocardia sp. alder85J TaxID=2862949 RepID=UPI001CD3F7EB|nr:MarR family transcriptional regulator [Nocardia sp. alder85J]MCX4092613.1 MarR family transcriptional regulator [Nocardia sp. alder85J]
MSGDEAAADLVTAAMTLHRETAVLYAEVARQFGLTSQQTQLLCLLSRQEPSFGEVAARLGCDKTNVTGMVDRLQQRGVLDRAPDRHDRRITRIRLTTAGDELRTRIRDALDTAITARLSALTPGERDRLAPLARMLSR